MSTDDIDVEAWVVRLIAAASVVSAKLRPGVNRPNWQEIRELHDALEGAPPQFVPSEWLRKVVTEVTPLAEIDEPEVPSGGPNE